MSVIEQRGSQHIMDFWSLPKSITGLLCFYSFSEPLRRYPRFHSRAFTRSPVRRIHNIVNPQRHTPLRPAGRYRGPAPGVEDVSKHGCPFVRFCESWVKNRDQNWSVLPSSNPSHFLLLALPALIPLCLAAFLCSVSLHINDN